MKILTIFCDMVRPNLMGLYNNDIELNPFDNQLKEIGGYLYKNCYTPGPDSPRSLACFWSGDYPSINGCDKRGKYPKFYLKSKSFLEYLIDKKYDMNFFVKPEDKFLGVLPVGFEHIGFHNKDFNLKEFLNNVTISDNSYTHISLTDFHWALDDLGATLKGANEGFRILSELIGLIRSKLNIKEFDYVFIFSDHGMSLGNEMKTKDKYKVLNKNRTNILMMVKTKEMQNLVENEKFCSIMDVYPTICNILNVPYDKGQGFSFLCENEKEHIVAEDHYNFTVKINQILEVWAIIRKDGIYFRELDCFYFENEGAFTESVEELDKMIEEYSASFKEYISFYKVLKLYQNMIVDSSVYTTGEKRKISKQRRIAILKSNISKIIKGLAAKMYKGDSV